jgi:hypothetical protein
MGKYYFTAGGLRQLRLTRNEAVFRICLNTALRKSLFKLTTALAFLRGAATAATVGGSKINTAIKFESVHMEIYFDGFGAFKELFVDDVSVITNFKFFISVVRLIQSHGQPGAASAAFI